jgi:arginine decarboxylase-like protein
MIGLGYTEKIIEDQGYNDYSYRDQKGKLVGFTRCTKEGVHEKESRWPNLINSTIRFSQFSEAQLDVINDQFGRAIEEYLKSRQKKKRYTLFQCND